MIYEKKEDGFFLKTVQSRSLCITVEMRKLWRGNAGRGEFTIKINKEQLLESPTQGRINGSLCAVELLAKKHCVLLGRKWLNNRKKPGKKHHYFIMCLLLKCLHQ